MLKEIISQTWLKPQASLLGNPELNLPNAFQLEESIACKREYLNRECWNPVIENIIKFLGNTNVSKNLPLDLFAQDGTLHFKEKNSLSTLEQQLFIKILEELIPWRKGPFNIFGEYVDAEWQSNLKWDRVSPYLDCLKGMRVLDLGCGNAYYMLRALEKEPEFIWGFDPNEKFFIVSQFLLSLIDEPRLRTEMLGAEDVKFLPEFFNAVLCMGVIYHQRNPLELLSNIHKTLRYRGLLVLESQIIQGSESVALFPEGRYAKARNVYFLPTVSCLKSWLKRAGFVEIEVVSVEDTELNEQRKTKYAPYESLEDFLDKDDPSKTIEGHPAPKRAVITARKRGK